MDAKPILATILGVTLGVGVYTFRYANGSSHLTDRPHACANCHIMRGHYESWLKSSHSKAAVCNDCHAPQGVVPKYAIKALNGFSHSFAFTTARYSDGIRITARNRRVAASACLKCHADMVSGIRPGVDCIECHRNVGHL